MPTAQKKINLIKRKKKFSFPIDTFVLFLHINLIDFVKFLRKQNSIFNLHLK